MYGKRLNSGSSTISLVTGAERSTFEVSILTPAFGSAGLPTEALRSAGSFFQRLHPAYPIPATRTFQRKGRPIFRCQRRSLGLFDLPQQVLGCSDSTLITSLPGASAIVSDY